MDIYSTTVTDKPSLNVGQTFNDYQELKNAFNVFCKEYHHPFIIRSHSERQIVYKCVHGIRQNRKSQSKRRSQRFYYDCEARINLYKGKNTNWKITKILLDHNHSVGEEEFIYYDKAKRLNDKDYNTVPDLFLSTNDALIPKSKSNEDNLPSKLFTTNAESDFENLRELLSKIEEAGGIYTKQNEDNKQVSSLFVGSTPIKIEMRDHTDNTNEVFQEYVDNYEDFVDHESIWSDQEKYNIALDVAKNIAYILSNYETHRFKKYIEELTTVEKNAKIGVSLFTANDNNQCETKLKIEPTDMNIQANEIQSNIANIKINEEIQLGSRAKRQATQSNFQKNNIKRKK